MSWDTIFKSGTHTSANGQTRTWSDADLDALAANTGQNAPIVIRHPKDQDKAVEFGKIARLRRFGDKLMAQYRDVPEILSMAVKEGLNLAKSVSIDPVKMEIRHIGLLGVGQAPAVEGLGPANFTATGGADDLLTYVINQINFEKMSAIADTDQGETAKETNVDPKDKEIQALKDEIKTLKADNETQAVQEKLNHALDELKTEKAAHEESKQEFEAYKKDRAEQAMETRVDALAQSGRIKPSEKSKVLAFAKALPDGEAVMEFCAPDGSKSSVTPREGYLRDLEALPADKDGLLSEFARAGHAGPGQDARGEFKNINDFC